MANTQWEQTAATEASYGVQVRCLRSKNTGLQIIIADVKGISNGIVNGYFVLPTEAHDDDGCPHTLEHLVFMGSQEYPYKGVLDHLANRSFAQGTNAWTDTDHTAYTLTTAGAEGFLNILPVYLDHVLYPTLTDAAFYTEVHHINGDGENEGVVYSEMQGRENTSSGRSFLSLQRSLFAGTGYASETGGLMANLRELTAQTVRDYHKAYYRPDNLTIIITGEINTDDIFKALEPIESKIMRSSVVRPPMVRPFSTPVPPLNQSVVSTVEFPDENDNSNGTVYVAFRGPLIGNPEEIMAVDLLWEYLTSTSVAPLNAQFVEANPPYCADVGFFQYASSVTATVSYFGGVPQEQMDKVLPRLWEVMEDVVKEGLDMTRMKNIIAQRYHKELEAMELSPHSTLSNALICYVLYGNSSEDLKKTLVKTSLVDATAEMTNDQWVALLKKYFIGAPHVAILSKPSAALSAKMQEEEAARIAKQIETLGEANLAELGRKLDEAVKENSKETPVELLLRFNIPNVNRISHIPVVAVDCNQWGQDEVSQHIKKDVEPSPLPFHLSFDHVNSNFVEINVHIDTAHLTPEERLFLELYTDVMFELPVRRDGVLVPYEQIVQELDADVSDNSNSVGFGGYSNFSCGEFSTLVIVGLRVDIQKYEKGVHWVQELLWQTEFTAERLRVAAQRLLCDIPESKRSGSRMCSVVMQQLNFPSPQGNPHACNLFRQNCVLKKVLEDLDTNPDDVIKNMTSFRTSLCQASQMRVQVICNALNVPNPIKPWSDLANNIPSTSLTMKGPAPRVTKRSEMRPIERAHKAVIIPMATIESSYLFQTVDGPNDYDSEDIAPLEVLLEYLTMAEGIFWTSIRGSGLAYGCGISLNVESGMIIFNLYKSSNVVAAYEAAKAIIDRFAVREEAFDDAKVQAAQSGMVFSYINQEKTMSMAAKQVFRNTYCTLLGSSTLKMQLARTQAVTKEDLYRVLDKYLVHIFDPARTNLVIATNPSKVTEVVSGLQKHTSDFQQLDDLESFFA